MTGGQRSVLREGIDVVEHGVGRRVLSDLVDACGDLDRISVQRGLRYLLSTQRSDGAWAERVLHPRYGHEREYEVSIAGPVPPASVAASSIFWIAWNSPQLDSLDL